MTCIGKCTYAWFSSVPLVIPSDDLLPGNAVQRLQKQKVCYVTLADNNVCTLTEIFRKAAQAAALSFCQHCLELIPCHTKSKLAYRRILSELKITMKNSQILEKSVLEMDTSSS